MLRLLITTFCYHQVLTTSDWTRPPNHILVEVGTDIHRTCQADTRSGMKNVTIILPDDAVISDYFRKISNMEERSKLTYQTNRNSGIITATLAIRNASILDTGFYGCRLIDSIESSTVLQNKEYVYVHPPINDSPTGSVHGLIDNEMLVDDLLLPTLDVYVLEEGKSDQVIPFKPTHPDVKLFLSRKPRNTNHYIEIFSTEYVAKKHDNWSWNKHRGLVVNKAQRNQTNGAYWCDAELNGRKTTRHFRVFVTAADVFDNLPTNRTTGATTPKVHQLDIPRIKKSVEFLIYPSGSPFKLVCQIGIGWNITWFVSENRRELNRHSVSYQTTNNSVLSTLSLPESSYLDTNNYTCFRNDAQTLLARQYVFISDQEKLLLPTNSVYVFKQTQRAIIPCRPTHPDIVVSLMKTAQTGRGVENITLFPNENGYWQYSKFRGFFTKDNADREIVGENYFCQGIKDGNLQVIQRFQVYLADIELKPFQRDSGLVVEGDEITLVCESYMKPAMMDWIPLNGNNSRIPVSESAKINKQFPAGISYIKTSRPTSNKQYTTELIWQNITKAASGVFECTYKDEPFRDVIFESYQMNVLEAKAPVLVNQKTKLSVEEGNYVDLACDLKEGAPLPNITWFKGGALVNQSAIEKIELMSNGTSVLRLKAAIDNGGVYTCKYENRLGKTEKFIQLTVIEDRGNSEMIAIIIVLIIIAVLLVIMARLLYIRFSARYQRTKHASNIAKILEPLLAGNPERINHHLPLDGQSELLPYDKTWEFPRDRLKLGQQLGAGCFGRVLKAEADGIVQESVVQTVAVKMVRSFADLSALASLVSELKILIHLGSQLNIVNLLGACTDIAQGDFLVIVEYCKFGSLLDYLLANRFKYVDQVNQHGEFVLPASAPSAISGYLYMGSPSDPGTQSINGPPVGQSIQQQDYLVMYKDGSASFQNPHKTKEDEAVLANHLLSTYHLLAWSFQISRGMEYLSGRKVVHGDLAARNVLLADNSVVKIADFGLSRKVYQDSNYKKKGEGMLPVKWMAIESLSDRIFSSQSDVWAFGITMWEMFSLGKAPYADIEDLTVLIQHLESGKRLEIPKQTPNSIAVIIANCWKADPFNRPTFQQLEQLLGDLIEPAVKNYYIEMDEPYRHRNIERFGNSVDIEPSKAGNHLTTGYINLEAEMESTQVSTGYQNVEAKMTE